MIIEMVRDDFSVNTTLGSLLFNNKHFGYTLEDCTRSRKVQGVTAIPTGMYELTVDRSRRFKRDMVRLLNVPGFTGIRVHGGNSHVNTDGCILLAKTRDDRLHEIQGTLEEPFTQLVKDWLKSEKVFLRISEAY